METKSDEDKELTEKLRAAKLKFLRRAGENVADSAVVAINSLLRDYEINEKFTPQQRAFVEKLIKTSHSLRGTR